MKPRLSPLEILDFAITQFDFSFNPSKEEVGIDTYYSKYDIDIDFSIQTRDFLIVNVRADINRGEQPMPGYSILCEATCFFKLTSNIKMSDQERDSIEGYSTLYISLNALRGLISGFTSNAPWGRYILPSIDLNDLIENKRKKLNTNSDKQRQRKRKKVPKDLN